ncbi:hypothetical protein T05_8652 [Trichinella murrelli]|uniref:Uncharacterized protein n=1 Tax=Trichinella murrelli TaxID=144512 RepID=A0A0V0T5M6_9BILA|nr:hypothetical protein T05_8652 [Trichinella murrelli]
MRQWYTVSKKGHSTTSTIVNAKSQVSWRPPSEDDDNPALGANGRPAGDQTGHLRKKMIEENPEQDHVKSEDDEAESCIAEERRSVKVLTELDNFMGLLMVKAKKIMKFTKPN